MRLLIFLLCIAITNLTSAQYYYNDIVTTKQTNKQYRLLKDNNIQEVIARSFEADGSMSQDFSLTQKLSENSTVITTTSEHTGMDRTISVSYYNNNKIKKTIDSSVNIKSTTAYTYNNNDLTSINIVTEDTFMKNSSAETHLWLYENSVPVRMLLIKNSIDTTVIQFVKDSSGNVAEEHWIKKGRRIETYLYFYNDKNLLTDIVRFNLKAGRLLPDFMFEYDEKGTITQFIQVPQASTDYLVWQYVYNANGLKQQEHCFTKAKQPVGRIEYNYR